MKQKIEVHIKVRKNITIFYNISGSKTVTQGSESVSYFATTEKNISTKICDGKTTIIKTEINFNIRT